MKTAMTLEQLATEVQRHQEAKRDFVADTRKIEIIPAADVPKPEPGGNVIDMIANQTMQELLDKPVGNGQPEPAPAPEAPKVPGVAMRIGNGDNTILQVNDHALNQIAAKLKVPARFARRLKTDHPDLLAETLNTLFQREPAKRLVRTLDGTARAFLSDRYRCMDNFDFLMVVLPIIQKWGCKIVSSNVTEHKLYLKVIRPDLVAELDKPEHAEMGQGHHLFRRITAGFCLQNSETGQGKLQMQAAFFDQCCTNFAVFPDANFAKYHLGAKLSNGGGKDAWELFSDKTRQVSDEALWRQVADVAEKSLNGDVFNDLVAKAQNARNNRIDADPAEVVELVSKKNGLADDTRAGILRHLIEGAELTQFGLQAAITRQSQDEDSYETATDLEKLGGDLLTLTKTQFKDLQKAA